MQDEKLFKICILTTIVGLLGIIILSGYVEPEKLTISQIDKSKIDNKIEVNATITDIYITKSKTRIITLTDYTGSINMVIFPDTLVVTDLKNGKRIKTVAKVTEYNGQLELILEEADNLEEI